MPYLQPRLFISYAREDRQIAEAIYHGLKGCQVFFDTKAIHVGDIFPEKIKAQLKKSDGCITIISNHSVKSEWCKLEIYYAHLLKKPLIPVRLGKITGLGKSPLETIQRDVNYAVIDPQTPIADVIELIQDRLTSSRQLALRRLMQRLSLLVAVILILVLFFTLGIGRINSLILARQKGAFLQQVRQSNKIYRGAEIDQFGKLFGNDEQLTAQLHLLEKDPALSPSAQINARILAPVFLASFNLAKRQYLKDLDWTLSRLQSTQFTNVTFTSGTIKQTSFTEVEFADVLFNGINQADRGVQLSALHFSNCGFNCVIFDQTNAIDLHFENCRFRGSTLDITNFGVVSFASKADSSTVTSNGQVTYFDNCLFIDQNSPDPKGTLVFGKEDEVQFKGVVFKACRFEGLIRKEWFHACSFEDCIFPKGTNASQFVHN
jgi:hypothetical protein